MIINTNELPIVYEGFIMPETTVRYCYLHFRNDTGFQRFIKPLKSAKLGMEIYLHFSGKMYRIKSSPFIFGRIDDLFEFIRDNPDIKPGDVFDIELDIDQNGILHLFFYRA